MSLYRMEELAAFSGGTLHKHCKEVEIADLLYDSRRVYRPSQSLFIALKSIRNDGHRYIAALIRQGLKNFLVSELPKDELLEQANYILVADTLEAMQRIAAAHRKRFDIGLVAITGSNGKTIVKEWIYELMRQSRHIARSPKSFNSQIGVPLSLWLINQGHDLALIETGISQPGEMERLQAIIKPTLGIFTNIGSAHLENFSKRENLIQEKLKLFDGVQKLYYCRDHEEIHRMVSEKGIQSVRWGYHPDSDYRIGNIRKEDKFCVVEVFHQGKTLKLSIPFADQASTENALHAAVFALDQGISSDQVCMAIKSLHPVEMRLELRKGKQQCTIINDSYSADTESLKIALDYMLQQVQHQKRTVILSDFPETGGAPELFYQKIAELLNSKQISRLIGVGLQIPLCMPYFKGEALFYKNSNELLQQIHAIPLMKECVLLKGARQFQFEHIFSALQEKFHETVLEVNLSAMIQNLNYYRSLLKPEVKTMAMVKAFSYGSGSAEVANALQANGIDYLAVAYVDEGIELRKSGITLPIMVMNPEPDSLRELINHGLEPEVYSFRILNQLKEMVNLEGGYEAYPVRIHLKLDTGMHRLGFDGEEVQKAAQSIKETDYIELASAFSHLAASEAPTHDDFTRLQIERFLSYTREIEQIIGKVFLKHILNSAGISRHPEGILDMVRLGIGLYGIGNAHEQDKLSHVSSFKTTISQIKQLPAGETIGYGRKGLLAESGRIATLALGYADGFPRRLGSGKGLVYIRGRQAPTVGNICMDMCMVDISHIPDACEGDPVIVFENAGQLQAMAGALDTIAYEVLTGISARVKRTYFQE